MKKLGFYACLAVILTFLSLAPQKPVFAHEIDPSSKLLVYLTFWHDKQQSKSFIYVVDYKTLREKIIIDCGYKDGDDDYRIVLYSAGFNKNTVEVSKSVKNEFVFTAQAALPQHLGDKAAYFHNKGFPISYRIIVEIFNDKMNLDYYMKSDNWGLSCKFPS